MAKTYSARQKRVKIKIEGADKIVKALKDMDEEASDVLSAAAKAGGEIALKDAVQNCPVDTGALRDSITMVINKVSDKRADVKIDFDKKLYYGVFVELGANGREPKPFLRNSVDNNQDSINKAIVESVSKSVSKRM